MLGEGLNFGLVPLKTTAERVLDEAIALNDAPNGMTFVRGTSAFNPYFNQITAPGARRRRPASIGRFRAFGLDLIEGPGANLLAAGSSDRFDLWSAITAQLVGGQVAPDGSLTAWTVTDSSAAAFQSLQQTITVANDASVYCISMYILKTSGGTSATFGINATLTGGTSVSANPRVNLDTGGILGATGSPVMTSVGAYWRLSMTITNNTSGNTSLNISIFPATAANGQSVDAATAIGSATLAWAQVEKAAFPSSYISNRNACLFSNAISGTGWSNSGTTGAVAQTGGALPSGETGWTFTSAVQNDEWSRNITVLPSTTYTVSWWAKLGTATNASCQIYDNTHGAFIVNPFTYTGLINAGVYTRVSTTFTTPAGCVTIIFTPVRVLSPGTTGTVLLGDMQCEIGSTATAYWGVNGTVGGRDADQLSVAYAMPTSGGTLQALCIPYGWNTDQDGSTLFRVFDGYLAGAEKIVYRRNSATQSILGTTDSVGGKNSTSITTSFINGALSQQVSVWDSTSVRTYVNGAHAGIDSAAPSLPFITTDTLWIGSSVSGTAPFYGWVCIPSWKRPLVLAEIQALQVALPVLT